jgi:hypothetical protein
MPRFLLLVDSCRVPRRGFNTLHRVREGDRSTGLTPSSSVHRSSISSSLSFFVSLLILRTHVLHFLEKAGEAETCYTRTSHQAPPPLIVLVVHGFSTYRLKLQLSLAHRPRVAPLERHGGNSSRRRLEPRPRLPSAAAAGLAAVAVAPASEGGAWGARGGCGVQRLHGFRRRFPAERRPGRAATRRCGKASFVACSMSQATAFEVRLRAAALLCGPELGPRWARRAAAVWRGATGGRSGGLRAAGVRRVGMSGSVLLLQEGGRAGAWCDVDGSVLLAHRIRSPAGEVACMVRVDAPEVWLRPRTMVVLGLGQCSAVPCRHGARQDTVAHAASGGPAFGQPFLIWCVVSEFYCRWSPRGAADCGGCRCFFIGREVRVGGGWWACRRRCRLMCS